MLTTDSIWETRIAHLEQSGQLHAPFFEQAVAWLAEVRPPASVGRVLDIGSGPGIMTSVLARAFPSAEVVAIDGAAALLERAAARAAECGVSERVNVLVANLPDDFADLPTADLIWSSRALHHLGDQQAAVDQLRERLTPGGLLAVGEGGLPPRCLPLEIGFGRPGLQARLQASLEEWFAEMRASLPDSRAAVDDWPGMLRKVGLDSVRSRSFLVDLPAPLNRSGRNFLRSQLVGLRTRLADRLAVDDLDALERLIDPEAADGLLQRSDVYFLAALTVHVGVRGE
jgi:SAM-dependent methyltransferase